MTEHSKIPVPPKGDGQSEDRAATRSLIERANGTFGLGGFGAPPVPRRIIDAPMKHARPGIVKAAPPAAPAPRAPVPAPVSEPVPETLAGPITGPVPVPAIAAVSDPHDAPARVTFGGEKHPVNREHLRNQGMIVPDAAATALLEEFRIIKRQLISAAKSGPAARRVLICSPLPGEGKTFCAVNMALAMAAEKDAEVVLVDADFAKPSILSVLGLPGRAGLMDALADPVIKVEDLVLGTDIPGLWVLPAGEQSNSDSEYLTSSRTAEVLDRLTRGAPNRMVIFDSPPALAASPAAELAKHVGQAVLVARADSTGRSALEDAYQLLSGCRDIKLLLNAAKFSPSGRRFGTYYGYEG
ncbi:capsular biosynthesis protein [Altererythrobacter aquiaggeris]|uniref:capsular biosynthesis protein n=1 Tax=Aestuarierythrobacter aquiaggeris TaxID=1898396 RepID=UPI003015FE6F